VDLLSLMQQHCWPGIAIVRAIFQHTSVLYYHNHSKSEMTTSTESNCAGIRLSQYGESYFLPSLSQHWTTITMTTTYYNGKPSYNWQDYLHWVFEYKFSLNSNVCQGLCTDDIKLLKSMILSVLVVSNISCIYVMSDSRNKLQ